MSEGMIFEGWDCTDIDSLQFKTYIGDGTYKFKEFSRFEYTKQFNQIVNGQVDIHLFAASIFWIEDTIKPESYTIEQVTSILSPYGYKKVKDGWIDDCGDAITLAIIAECIFEQESGLY